MPEKANTAIERVSSRRKADLSLESGTLADLLGKAKVLRNPSSLFLQASVLLDQFFLAVTGEAYGQLGLVA